LTLGNEKPDTELIKLLKKGEMTAFNAIYAMYCHKIHEFVFRYLKQEEDAEEIVQEVFVKIWQARDKIDVYASFESFLFTIAYNATISLLRKRMNDNKSREYLKSLQQIDTTDQITNELHFKELNQKVQSLLGQLTSRQREVYLLSREEGLTHKEIAERLNISENTVNNHLVTTLKYLKSHISNNLTLNIFFFHLFL
jgi:RNA polymerase sigma-70 factor (ECF subfamily)